MSRLKRPGAVRGAQRTPIPFPAQDMPKQPLLSIGMIFRNDKRSIRRCLEALAPLRKAIPCQLVMVDTGSTDGSRRIAEQYADILLDFEWIDDFAAARNFGLERCTGVWFMQLDTDEYLDPDIDELVGFLTDPRSEKYDAASVVIRNYFSFDFDVNGDYSTFSPSRISRRRPERKFVGAVHESIPLVFGAPIFDLSHTVLHHDGYANEIFIQKSRRNLPLLVQAFSQNAHDSRTLGELLDVCTTAENARRYAPLAFPLARETHRDNPYCPVMLRRAVHLAAKYLFPELPDWIAQARELCPDSPFVLTDVSYFAVQHAVRQSDDEAVLREAASYFDAVRRYDSGEFSVHLRFGSLDCVNQRPRQYVRFCVAQAHYHLENYAQCLAALSQDSLAQCANLALIDSYLSQLSLLWRKTEIDGVSELLARQWQSLAQDESRLGNERRKQFYLAACGLLDRDPKDDADEKPELRPAAQMFAALGPDCPAGLAAMILEAPDADEVRRLMERVDDWELMPSRVLDLALMLGLPMPDSFYRSNAEVLQSHAAGLCRLRGEQAPEAARTWADTIDEPTPGQLMWLYDLTLAVMLKHDWRAESDQSVPLCELFLTLVQLWLDTFYNPAIVNDEMIHLLPATLRFGWHFLQAQAALNAGDPVGYVRRLRQGLQTAPSMKELVRFLSAQVDRAANQPRPSSQDQQELMELARAVRDRVAELRAAGDPAADAIVQSEQYRLLLPLIEGFSDEPQS